MGSAAGGVAGGSLPDNEVHGQKLAVDVIARPCAHVGILRGFEGDKASSWLVCPCRKDLLADRLVGGRAREIVRGLPRRMEEGIKVVAGKGVDDFEDDIHGGRRKAHSKRLSVLWCGEGGRQTAPLLRRKGT